MLDEKIRALSGITLAYVSDGEAGSLTVRYAPTNITSENDMTMEPDQYTKYLGILKDGGDITIKADYDWALIKGQKGNDGITPIIGSNGNWWIGEVDTGVKAEGKEGESGQTPFIGSNGNWWIGAEDTGISAEGPQGPQGEQGIQGPQGEQGEQGNPGVDGEDAVLLRIESSRGTVFKNDQISTVLSVVIYKGSHRITNSTEMKAVFGNGAYLQWRWLKLDDESYGIISASDPRFGNGGFTFTLSPDDVDTKVTFECKLML